MQIGEVVGRQNLPLHDREVDLDLVEPACVDGQMDQDELGVMPVTASQTADRALPAMGRAVVDDPEDPVGFAVGGLHHDVGHQSVERLDSGGALAPAEQLAS